MEPEWKCIDPYSPPILTCLPCHRRITSDGLLLAVITLWSACSHIFRGKVGRNKGLLLLGGTVHLHTLEYDYVLWGKRLFIFPTLIDFELMDSICFLSLCAFQDFELLMTHQQITDVAFRHCSLKQVSSIQKICIKLSFITWLVFEGGSEKNQCLSSAALEGSFISSAKPELEVYQRVRSHPCSG